MAYRWNKGTAAITQRHNAKERRRAKKQMNGLMGFIGLCCSVCAAGAVLLCKSLVWLCKWLILAGMWCWKQLATAAGYVALGVKDWWEHRGE